MYKRQVTETAVGNNVIVHSTPIVAQAQLSETSVDSGIQLTPVSTNKSKQSEETDIMSFLRKMDNKFDMLNKRFDDNDKILHTLLNDRVAHNKIDVEQAVK